MQRTRKDAENRVRNHTDGMFDVASFSISPFMLSSSCKSVSEASGEMKFGILAGEPKTTYHALRPWLDLRIWKSKDFLMYNFSAADQSTAAGHEDPPPTHTTTTLSAISIPYSDSLLCVLLPYQSAGCT